MSKYEPLWAAVQREGRALWTFAEIESVLGFPLDHSFLNFKKELPAYGYQVGKISLKNQTVAFEKL